MCLTLTENSKLKVAEENIICYKVVHRLQPGIYMSEFYNYLYETGTLNVSPFDDTTITTRPCITGYRSIKFDYRVIGYEQIVERGFHSFTCKEDAYKYAKIVASRVLGEITTVVVKYIIPKGANYIEGTYEEYPNYVSDKIICVKEV